MSNVKQLGKKTICYATALGVPSTSTRSKGRMTGSSLFKLLLATRTTFKPPPACDTSLSVEGLAAYPKSVWFSTPTTMLETFIINNPVQVYNTVTTRIYRTSYKICKQVWHAYYLLFTNDILIFLLFI
jgi:hypothetical protein